ncbi:hypothetical protein C0581_01025 [Candidatus Parcubacteria bacterium]|nr:MAG: hypothetical protein C0581_01025 [Candidatus Parcubacteria bacterium]
MSGIDAPKGPRREPLVEPVKKIVKDRPYDPKRDKKPVPDKKGDTVTISPEAEELFRQQEEE